MSDEWVLPNGEKLKFQDGDFVRIDISSNPEAATMLPFLSGYVRGYDASIEDGAPAKVGYALFKVGHNMLVGVKEERLVKAPSQFGITHGQGAHQDGRACHLCGANL
jgi:hypothetical protein